MENKDVTTLEMIDKAIVLDEILVDIKKEIHSAILMYDPFNSAHEGIAIIEEEYLELREWVYMKQSKRDPEAMKKEAIQLAAMAVRFVVDLHYTDYRK